MRNVLGALTLLVAGTVQATIPATPVMTVYEFNGPLEVPYFDASDLSPAGTLSQGTSLIPCLPLRDGQPLTDANGTPYVGFELVVDARQATPAATEDFKRAVAARKEMTVKHHHCTANVRHVIGMRALYVLEKAPFFDPPLTESAPEEQGISPLDRVVRAFHASGECAGANVKLTGRRSALKRAWDDFIRAHADLASPTTLDRARHLDYVMRTAIYEGHLGRGCNAYGACERNIVALSIRNRAIGQCRKNQGCGFPGDFQGVSSAVSQYNIWDEYLTQISGLTSCFLRPDLARNDHGAKLQAIYAQNLPDIERILFGDEVALGAVFPETALADLTSMRHYYHAPAMGKCFPNHERVEYIRGAVARNGDDFALIANTRIHVGDQSADGYAFEEFRFEETPEQDLVRIEDNYPGFLIDARKVSRRAPGACPAYGIPSGCQTDTVGRYRKTPNWLRDGRPLGIVCRVSDRGASCQDDRQDTQRVEVGGVCDKEMRPVAGVR